MTATLNKINHFPPRLGPTVLIILDGVGIGKDYPGNAVFLAHPENFNAYLLQAKQQNLYAQLQAHGVAVGLPTDGDMGNSEVGHNALGSGQIYAQGAKLVNESLRNGAFFQTATWKNSVEKTAQDQKTVHFIGLLSDGNVHSHIEQLFAIMDGCLKSGIKKIRVHPLLDGRDVPPTSALLYLDQLEQRLLTYRQQGIDALVASGGGRMYLTMDRYYSDWAMVRRGWMAHVLGKIQAEDITSDYPGYFSSATEAINMARQLWPKKQDQFNPPFVIVDGAGRPVGKMQDGDTVINFNFRGDRAIQISEAFELENFTGFDRIERPKVHYCGLLEYDGDRHLPANYLVPPPTIKNVSGEYFCAMGIKSYAISETHKFGHVTYFWNGNRSGKIDEQLETYVEIKSDSNDQVESLPKMKAQEITTQLVAAIGSGKYQYLRANFANGDMVGHTGNINACIEAIRTVDQCLQQVVDATLKASGVIIVTADHGNSEEKIDAKGNILTSHTLNPVPFFIIDSTHQGIYQVDTSHIKNPGLANVAATVFNLMGYQAPDFYGPSLIRFR